MFTFLSLITDVKTFIESHTCADLKDCLLYYGLAINVFSVLILAMVEFSRTRIAKVIIGDIWSLILVTLSIVIIMKHPCLYTTITTIISFVLLILITVSVGDDKNIKAKETDDEEKNYTYVVKNREGGTYSFFLYNDTKVEVESKFTYSSVDDAVKAINIIKAFADKADKEKKLGGWSKYTTYPMFEIIQNDKFYNYKLSINEKYTILISKKFKKYDDCYDEMYAIVDALKNSEVYISDEKPKYYESAVLDPYFDDIEIPSEEGKEVPIKVVEVPVVQEVKAKEVVQETPVKKETIIEEPSNQEPATEVVEEEKPQITLKNNDDDDDDKEEKEIVIVDGKEMYVTYRKSIFAKLTLARPETKANYVELANYICKYDVRRRDSWEFISYFKGKDTILKLGVKGRTLFIYYGLPYEEYKETGYFLKEAKAKAHEKTPTVLRVKSDRALKHAKELVDELMKRNELVKDETRPDLETIEKYNEKTLDDLLKDGYIKYLFTEVPKEEQTK